MASPPNKASGQMRRVVNQLLFLEKRSVFQYKRARLYPSEIHLMQVINENPDLNAGKMAQKLGISNGAVSQTLTRLERKGIIIKTKDPALKNELTVTFTASGQAAISGFEKKQAPALTFLNNYFKNLSASDQKAIESFLAHMEEFLKKLG
jgi:DNA-binding MarR family transcriptional regulator